MASGHVGVAGGSAQAQVWDQVATGGPNPNRWTRDQFERLPLIDRVRLLSSGDLHFYQAGREVPAREALKSR